MLQDGPPHTAVAEVCAEFHIDLATLRQMLANPWLRASQCSSSTLLVR